MPGFVSESTLESRLLRRSSWHRPRFVCNHPCRLRLSRPCLYVLRPVTFGSGAIGGGVITIGCGHLGTGVRPLTWTAMFVGVMPAIGPEGSVPNATRAFMAIPRRAWAPIIVKTQTVLYSRPSGRLSFRTSLGHAVGGADDFSPGRARFRVFVSSQCETKMSLALLSQSRSAANSKM
jgi:hypothetical protein